MEDLKRLESIKIEVETLIPLEHDIDRSLICLICQEILKLPVECQYCKNNFCKKCIENWLTKNNSCPFRCTGKILLKKPHKIIMDSLKRLHFNCKNISWGCPEKLNYDQYIRHIEECEYNNIKCSVIKCNKEVLVRDLKFHLENECEFNLHICNKCGFERMGPSIISHECEKYSYNLFNDIKSNVESFLYSTNTRVNNLNEKFNNLKEIVLKRKEEAKTN
jgi:hypothetical protein